MIRVAQLQRLLERIEPLVDDFHEMLEAVAGLQLGFDGCRQGLRELQRRLRQAHGAAVIVGERVVLAGRQVAKLLLAANQVARRQEQPLGAGREHDGRLRRGRRHRRGLAAAVSGAVASSRWRNVAIRVSSSRVSAMPEPR